MSPQKSTINVRSKHQRPTCPNFCEVSNVPFRKAMNSQSAWSVRLEREFQHSAMCVFITLTFDDEHLPIYKDYGFPCFDGERVSEQLIRPLRQVDLYKFKYVFFPEYGSDKEYIDYRGFKRVGTKRPHYHGLMFFDEIIDLEIFKQRVYFYWNSCIKDCLKILRIYDNHGFTRYVSKYVSKGIEYEHFPSQLLVLVKYWRKYLREVAEYPYPCPALERYHVLSKCAKLHYYEQHRPKILCSNGIGDYFTEKELHDGEILSFNGQEFKTSQIPPTQLRNYAYDKGKSYCYTFTTYKDGYPTFHDSVQVKKNSDWILNDKGRAFRKDNLKKRVDRFTKAFNTAITHPDTDFVQCQKDFVAQWSQVPYTNFHQICLRMKLLLRYTSIETIVAWKFFLSKYSVEFIKRYFGDDITIQDVIDNWMDFYDRLCEMPHDSQLYSPIDNEELPFITDEFDSVIEVLDLFELVTNLDMVKVHEDVKVARELRKNANTFKY